VLYKFTYGYSSSGITRLSENVLYFFSLSDNAPLHIISSENEIRSTGISLFNNGSYISIKYHGYLSENISSFSAIFDGKYYSGNYISNLTLLNNHVNVASLYFSSEIFTSATSAYLLSNTGFYYSSFEWYGAIYTSLRIDKDPNYLFSSPSSHSIIYLNYGDTSYYNRLNNANWNPNLGYEAVQSYLITNYKITDSIMNDYLNNFNNYVGAYKIAYENFLTALSYMWLVDKLADEISYQYGSTFNKNDYVVIRSSVGVDGRTLDVREGFFINFIGPDVYTSIKSNQELSFKCSLIEQYVVGLNGVDSTCAVSEVMKGIFNNKEFYYYENNGRITLKLADNSSYLEFTQRGIASIISASTRDNYNGGISLGPFSFTQNSQIVSNLLNLKIEPIGITKSLESMLVSTLNLSPEGQIIAKYASEIIVSILGTKLVYGGATLVATGTPISVGIGGVAIVVGTLLVLDSNGVFEDPSDPKGYFYSSMDLTFEGVGGKAVKYVSKFGLDNGAEIAFRTLLVDRFTTYTSQTIKK